VYLQTRFLVKSFNIVTINILVDLSHWKARRNLLVEGLSALQPDFIALQEVSLPENPADWLAHELGLEYCYLSAKTGFEASREAIAILSRRPISARATLDLEGQQRVAQYVQLDMEGRSLVIANTHLYWQPGNSAVRLRQVGRIIRWLQDLPPEMPVIVCGDFNGTPETTALAVMRQHYRSAHAVIHGREPGFTCPTPLPRSTWSVLRTFLGFFLLLRPQHIRLDWRGTLDYIFVNRQLAVNDCRVVLDQPSPVNPRIYPSDHYGILANLSFGDL
jgi:endonuclease/exonuclease/phosphatase family metal-dependent hydrolase